MTEVLAIPETTTVDAPEKAAPTIERAYRLRAYPTSAQRLVIARLIGATRHVWNWALAKRQAAYRADKTTLNWVALLREYTTYRRDPERPWLVELPREPFNQVLRNLESGYARFFENRKLPKAKRRKVGLPRFKRRGDLRGVRFTLDQRREQVARGEDKDRWAWVDLPGVGKLKLRRSQELLGRLRSVTVTRDSAGRFFASFTADRVPAPVPMGGGVEAVGVDRGLRDLLTTYDGAKVGTVKAPKPLSRNLVRLARYQRRQSRQLRMQMVAQGLDPTKRIPKGTRLGMSHRRQKVQRRIARLHARVAEVRRDTTQRATTDLMRYAKIIGIETLRVKAMQCGMGRRAFRRAVADAAMGEVGRELAYKAAWYGRTVIKVDPFFPSSKKCHVCGQVNRALKLEKHWECPHCGAHHDRDENAAINLREEALRLHAEQSPALRERRIDKSRGDEDPRPAAHQATGEPSSSKRGPRSKRAPTGARPRPESRQERGAGRAG